MVTVVVSIQACKLGLVQSGQRSGTLKQSDAMSESVSGSPNLYQPGGDKNSFPGENPLIALQAKEQPAQQSGACWWLAHTVRAMLDL